MRCLWYNGERDPGHEGETIMSTEQSFIFRSEGHKDRFLEAIKKNDKVYNGKIDAEYGAALLLLTANLSIWNRTRGYVSGDCIDFEQILDIHFSTTETTLVQVAGNLFSGAIHANPVDLVRLDNANFEVAIQALRMRRNPPMFDELEAQ
jgi:hypothetical protein